MKKLPESICNLTANLYNLEIMNLPFNQDELLISH